MGYINYKILKHELPDNMQWLKNRTILLTRTGSHAYGTNTPESDEDYRGVCIPPPEYYLGLKSINEYNTKFKTDFLKDFSDALKRLEKNKLIKFDNENLKIVNFSISNAIILEFFKNL